MWACGVMGRVEEPPIQPYPYKYKNIPIMEDYNGNLSDQYWSKWNVNPYSKATHSWISGAKLAATAEACGYIKKDKLRKVLEILENGARIGCEGTGRLESEVPNSPTVAKEGSKVADQLHDWVMSGIVNGPFKKSEMPFESYKISPMGVQPKPGGKIRIILDLSAPHDVAKDSLEANSVNSGIDSTKLVTNMSSIKQVCERIWKFGFPSEFSKADWTSAYKHVSVSHEDRHLQVFQFCGRLFIESQLTFGARSSPDRFDVVSDVPLEIALWKSKMWKGDIIKQLDDVCCFGRKGTGSVQLFYDNYRDTCEKVGVLLASEEDPEKAFGPSTKGVILGVEFNLDTFTWNMSRKKADRLLAILWTLFEQKHASLKIMESVVGKINHYRLICPFGRWERSWLLGLIAQENRNPLTKLNISGLALDQLSWWIRSIQLAKEGSRIPDPRGIFPKVCLLMFPDASGGMGQKEAGVGSWFMTKNKQPWIQIPWPDCIRENQRNTLGVTFGNKLTTLEGVAALAGFLSEPDLVRNKAVTILTDNIGLVYAFEKGHSKCLYAHTIAKALHYVSVALNTSLKVEKVKRRSCVGAIVADDLSKGDIPAAISLMDDPSPIQSYKSRVLGEWMEDPKPSRILGENIVEELANFTAVLDWGQF